MNKQTNIKIFGENKAKMQARMQNQAQTIKPKKGKGSFQRRPKHKYQQQEF